MMGHDCDLPERTARSIAVGNRSVVKGSGKMRSSHVPQLIATAGPLRIEKVSGGYQLWNDYRFIAFFVDLREAESRMEKAIGSAHRDAP